MPKTKILIVENERIVAEETKRKLQNTGYEVTAIVSSGSEALSQIKKNPPDLVLMDIKLRGKMDGIETADLIRIRFDIPVVYVTAYADFRTLVRTKKTEPIGFITKPVDIKELKGVIETGLYKYQMEKKLNERDAWLFTTLRCIGDAVIVTDTSGKITFMNPVAEELTGWNEEESRGKPLERVFKIINEDTGKPVENPVERVLKESKVVGLANHTVLITKDGRHIPIYDSGSPIRNDKGNIIGIVLNFNDITERKQAEEEREKLIHDMGERIKELSCMYGITDSIRKRTTLEEIFKDVAALIPPGWHYPEITRGRVVFEGNEYVSCTFEETEWRQSSDIIVGGECRGSVEVFYLEERPELYEGPFLKEERNLLNAIAHTLSETVDRKRAEEVLRRLGWAVESASDAIGIADVTGKSIYHNNALVELLGYTIDELNAAGGPPVVYKDPDTAREVFDSIMEGGSWSGEIGMKTRTGHEVLVFMRANCVKDDNGRITGLIGIHTDITERKQAEQVKAATYSISAAAMSAEDLEGFFHSIHNTIRMLMPAKNFYIALYDSESQMLSFPYFVDEEEKQPAPYKLGRGLTEYVLRSGQPLLASPEVFEKLVKKGELESVGPPSVDWLGVPLKIKNMTMGVLVVQSYTEGVRYEEEQKNILMFVSTQIAMAIERKRAEEQIQKDLKEKEVLLKEIHHRVKNNLQVISSLLGLQAKHIKDKQALKMFEASKNRVRSMGLIHEELYRSKDFTNIDFASYIKNLTDQLVKTYIIDSGKIELDVKVEDVSLGIDQAIPIGLVINELVSNALKYAFPPSFKGKGKIELTLCSMEAGEIELIVKDNGVGIPKEPDIRKTESLGMQLVYIMAEDQLDGKVTLDRRRGTKFTIRFKQK